MSVRRASILVVDDEPLLRDLLVDILESSGHHALAASDGDQAMATLRTTAFDLVISDIRMPGMDGFTLLAQIRGLNPGLPVVLVSAFATEESVSHAQPDGFLSKPFRINQIEELITRLLSSGRTGQTTAAESQRAQAKLPID